MIVGTGIDIAEVHRVGEAMERFGARFLHRVFTEGERRYCDSKANRVERYAVRFAAKEAAMKPWEPDGAVAFAGVILRFAASPEAVPRFLFTARLRRLLRNSVPFTSRCRSRTPPSKPSPKSFLKTDVARSVRLSPDHPQ